MPLTLRHLAGSEDRESIFPFIFYYDFRLFGKLCEQIVKASGMAKTQQQGKAVGSLDAPASSAVLHTVSNERVDVAFHTSQPGMVHHPGALVSGMVIPRS